MECRVLGPLTLIDDGVVVTPSSAKQRQLLALLLMHPNMVVPVSTITEELWPHNQPRNVAGNLQTHVLYLRRTLAATRSVRSPDEARRVLRTHRQGYELRVRPGELDLAVFELRTLAARAAVSPFERADLLRAALDLWEGEPLSGLPAGPVLRMRIAALRESRQAVLEQRIDADLLLGRHAEILGELGRLAAASPTNENIHAQLMIALYRSGRQREAIRRFDLLRRRLVEELGLEPMSRLRRLHYAILRDDPALGTFAM